MIAGSVLDHLVDKREQLWGNIEFECLGGRRHLVRVIVNALSLAYERHEATGQSTRSAARRI